MCGKIRNDKITNVFFREHIGVASIGDKIRETVWWWFGHIQHKLAMMLVRSKRLAIHVGGPPEKDMDGGGKNRSEGMKLICEFGSV